MIITNSLGSNYTAGDRLLALKLLFQPWKWQNGPEIQLLENEIATSFDDLGTRNDVIKIQLFLKGRHAIYEALRRLGIGRGDEVLVQAFTCVAVIQPILDLGATPIYVDVDSKSLNPSLAKIKKSVSAKTKAVILQHTLGYINRENDKIVDWCRNLKISVVQDLAHSFGALAFEKAWPSVGRPGLNKNPDAIVLSFSQDKVIDGISGGGLIVSDNLKLLPPRLNDSNHLTLLEIGKLLLYPICTWLIRSTYQFGIGGFRIGKGIHWLAKLTGLMNSPVEAPKKPLAMPNAFAALALNQLNRLDQIISHRRNIALIYDRILNKKLKVITPVDIKNGSCLRYPLWVENRDELENKLTKHDFYLMDHWYDAPVSPKWVDNAEVKYHPGSCPNAENLSKHIFNLPTHINISEEKAEKLANLINIYQNTSKRPGLSRKAWPFYNSLIYMKQNWENNLNKFPDANFLQSWAWGEFHQKLGRPVYRVEFEDGMFQGLVEPAKRGRHLIVPGGPLLKNYFSVSQWQQAVMLMKEIAVKEKCVFIRIRPQAENSDRLSEIAKQIGFLPAPMHLHAQLTRLLDLSLPDDVLLSQMRKSTRYEIRRALKMGIATEQSDDEKLIDDFIMLQDETAKREGFVPFSKKYLLEQFRELKKDNAVKFFYVIRPGLAKARPGLSKPISIAFVIFYRGEAVYHYAASSDESRKIPAAYAIQWAIIQEAKKRNCRIYNLWGDVADEKLSAGWRTHRFATYHLAHRFAGPSLFKRGFGGRQFAYFPAHDLPLSWKYWINWGIENLRKMTRSL